MNYLILDENGYNYLHESSVRRNRDSTNILTLFPSYVIITMDVIAVCNNDCVEFIKNRYTNDTIMSVEDFKDFKIKYLD